MPIGYNDPKYAGKPDPWAEADRYNREHPGDPNGGNEALRRAGVIRYGYLLGMQPTRKAWINAEGQVEVGEWDRYARAGGAEYGAPGIVDQALEAACRAGEFGPVGGARDCKLLQVEKTDMEFGNHGLFNSLVKKYGKSFPAAGDTTPDPVVPPPNPPTVPHPIGTGPTAPNPNPPSPPAPPSPEPPKPETLAREVVEAVLIRLFELVPEWEDENGVQVKVGKRSAARQFLFFAQKELLK